MRTHIHHLTAALAAALIAWSGPVPLPATEYEASDFLPLAVGNSWTFGHEVYDPLRSSRSAGVFYGGVFDIDPGDTGSVTIAVERTEVIGDTTYYVLSDLPAGWAPPPPHCPVGKTLRWKGSELMERTDTGERSFFRFEGDNPYTIPWTHGDDEVTRHHSPVHELSPVPEVSFEFFGHDAFDWGTEAGRDEWYSFRGVGFLASYGLAGCSEWIPGPDYPVFRNILMPVRAVLVEDGSGGASGQSGTTRTVRYDDALDGPPSSTSSTTWGRVKAR